MKARVFLTHIVLAIASLAGMAIIVSYGLSSWWRVAAVVFAIGLTGSWMRYLTIGSVVAVLGTITIVFPMAMLMVMSYYYDGRVAVAEHIDLVGWVQVFAPTAIGAAIVWLRRHLSLRSS